ncbi:MAG: protein kinase [Anaerolineae bacterium]|nr:protein kinase [Anaerolineae bacterium]
MAGETVLNGRYALVAQQGSGGMSVIYKAVDRALGRTVAVKILRPSLTAEPSFLEKFRNEARASANLSHPNIVTVYDVGSEGPTHYIVMELVEGTDLKKIIKADAPLPIDRALDIGIQICDGVGYAHRSGLVHADVKPQNILVTSDDVVKVTDFGIAQALSDTQPMQRAEVVWGSPHYFAPEQARGEQPTPAADVYAIGIVLFEMVTGRLPFSGSNQQELAMAHIRERAPLATDFNPKVPESLAKIILKVMSKEPNERYRTADQLGNILRGFRDRSRDNTAPGAQVSPRSTMPSTPPEQGNYNSPPGNRPPGIGVPHAPSNSEVTAKYSAAPNAPASYDPRRPSQQEPPSIPAPNPVLQPAQPFESRFAPPVNAPQQQAPYGAYQVGESSGYYPPQHSQPIPVGDEGGADYVTIILAILAVMAVVGLILLWIVILATR